MAKKKLNPYFTAMLKAKKNNAKSFVYKGKTYKKAVKKNGLIIYKK